MRQSERVAHLVRRRQLHLAGGERPARTEGALGSEVQHEDRHSTVRQQLRTSDAYLAAPYGSAPLHREV